MSAPKLYHYFLTVRLQPNGACFCLPALLTSLCCRPAPPTRTHSPKMHFPLTVACPVLFCAAETGAPEAVVDARYPSGELPKAENSLMAMITQFCFPDKEKFPKHNLSPKSKSFTFVVTNIEGVKRYGYVRRSLTGQISISNQGKRWPICHCILSVFPCASIFDQILEATSRLEPHQVLDLMTQLEHHSLPAPGDAIYASISIGDAGASRLEAFRFSRPEQEQSLSGFANFKALLTTIDPFTIVTILMSLLMERRVIFISRKLSTLSACVQGCVALLYPFTWQHVFIPVLPLGMIQFVCAPVPFVVGLLSSHLPELQAQAELMDEVILIDVESSSPVPPTSDFKLVPEKYLLPLVAAIDKARRIVLEEQKKTKSDKSMGDKLKHFFNSGQNDKERSLMTPGSRSTVALAEYFKESQPQDNVAKMIENAFISFFAETMGHYTNYLTATQFDKAAFLAYDPIMTPFLTGVSGSQLFEQFIVQRQSSSRIKGKTQLGPLPKPRELSSSQVDLNSDAKLSEVILREGYLSKWGKGMKGNAWAKLKERSGSGENSVGTFQLRWWKLTYWTLSYHKSEDAKPSGSIPLQEIEAVNVVDFRHLKDVIEVVTSDRVYQLHTENNADTMWWLEILHWKLGLLREYAHPFSASKSAPVPVSTTAATTSATTSATNSGSKTTTSSSPRSGGLATSPRSAAGASSSSSSSSSVLVETQQPSATRNGTGESDGGGSGSTSHAATTPSGTSNTANGNNYDATRGSLSTKSSARPASKVIVSTYMKERMSSDRSQQAKISSASSGGGGSQHAASSHFTASATSPVRAATLRAGNLSSSSSNSTTTTSTGSQPSKFGPKSTQSSSSLLSSTTSSSSTSSASQSSSSTQQPHQQQGGITTTSSSDTSTVRGRAAAVRGQSQSGSSTSQNPSNLSASHPPPLPAKGAGLHAHINSTASSNSGQSKPSSAAATAATTQTSSTSGRPFFRGGNSNAANSSNSSNSSSSSSSSNNNNNSQYGSAAHQDQPQKGSAAMYRQGQHFNTARSLRLSARATAQDVFATTDSAPSKTNSSALLVSSSSSSSSSSQSKSSRPLPTPPAASTSSTTSSAKPTSKSLLPASMRSEAPVSTSSTYNPRPRPLPPTISSNSAASSGAGAKSSPPSASASSSSKPASSSSSSSSPRGDLTKSSPASSPTSSSYGAAAGAPPKRGVSRPVPKPPA